MLVTMTTNSAKEMVINKGEGLQNGRGASEVLPPTKRGAGTV